MVTIEEAEAQNAMSQIDHGDNALTVPNLKAKMVEMADVADDFAEQQVNIDEYTDVLKSTAAFCLRELSKYKNIIDAMEEVEA